MKKHVSWVSFVCGLFFLVALAIRCGSDSNDDRDRDADGFPTRTDCDDHNPDIHPGAEEVCNGLDDNCDGQIDEGFDQDGDGFTSCGGDCNDSSPLVNPLATDVCDAVDNNCDGRIDEDFDKDGDGWSSCAGDCNDDDANIHPGANDVCEDGIDQDCDGRDLPCREADQDGDEFSPATGDCNDTDPKVFPGAVEVCDGIDNNCDGVVDPGRGDIQKGEHLAGIQLHAKLRNVIKAHGKDYTLLQACSNGTCLLQYATPYPLLIQLWDKDYNGKLSTEEDVVLAGIAFAPYNGTTEDCVGIASPTEAVEAEFGPPGEVTAEGWHNYGGKGIGSKGIGFQIQDGKVKAVNVWNMDIP